MNDWKLLQMTKACLVTHMTQQGANAQDAADDGQTPLSMAQTLKDWDRIARRRIS